MKDACTKHQHKGQLLLQHNFGNPEKRALSTCDDLEFAAAALSVSTLRSRQGFLWSAFGRFSAVFSTVRPDKRVDETFLTIISLDAMRQVWLSGYIVSHGESLSSYGDNQSHTKRLNEVRSQSGNSSMQCGSKTFRNLGPHLRDFCECPWSKHRESSSWLERRTETRRLLVEFWRYARGSWQQYQQDYGLDNDVVDAVVNHMTFDRSPRYLAEVQEERMIFEADLQRSQAARSLEKEDQ